MDKLNRSHPHWERGILERLDQFLQKQEDQDRAIPQIHRLTRQLSRATRTLKESVLNYTKEPSHGE